MTKVTITFTIDENTYKDYEYIVDAFSNDLDCLGIDDLEIKEEEV